MESLLELVRGHLLQLFPATDVTALVSDVVEAVGIDAPADPPLEPPLWDESTSVVIAYGDSLRGAAEVPLVSLGVALDGLVGDQITHLHVLPFFPWSSDDGFAVIDHHGVDPALGTWADIEELASGRVLMADLVVNHVSSRSRWFEQFVRNEEPGRSYLKTAAPTDDLSAVVRPRTHDLLRPVQTSEGVRHVWCTFGPDQVDLDFTNPAVLLEILRILDRLLAAGVRWIRLDAVAYVGKRVGTPCIHLPETHELVRLLHTLLRWRQPDAVLVTETNVPHGENVSYFGEGDEAHIVYNFSLAPLIVHSVLSESASAFTRWAAGMPPAPEGSAYLNFIASHDGIGLRPAESLLGPGDLDRLVERTEAVGGQWSAYNSADGPRPYELNVGLFDLVGGPREVHLQRYLAAHTIMFAVAGVPALYLHSLLGTPNDLAAVADRGIARAINRRKLTSAEVGELLAADGGRRGSMLTEMLRRLAVRAQHRAFHPDRGQRAHDLGDAVVALERGDDEVGRVLCLTNVTAQPVRIELDGVVEWGGRGGAGPNSLVDLLHPSDTVGPMVELGPFQSRWLSASTAS